MRAADVVGRRDGFDCEECLRRRWSPAIRSPAIQSPTSRSPAVRSPPPSTTSALGVLVAERASPLRLALAVVEPSVAGGPINRASRFGPIKPQRHEWTLRAYRAQHKTPHLRCGAIVISGPVRLTFAWHHANVYRADRLRPIARASWREMSTTSTARGARTCQKWCEAPLHNEARAHYQPTGRAKCE